MGEYTRISWFQGLNVVFMKKNPVYSYFLALAVMAAVAGSVIWKDETRQLLASLISNSSAATAANTSQDSKVVLAPPSISWVAPPQVNAQGRLALSFKVGASAPIHSVKVRIAPVVKVTGIDIAKEEVDVPSFAIGKKSLDWDGHVDFTSSLLAGTPVVLEIVVEDDDKRTGTSEGVSLSLPERNFNQPVARAIYTLRKVLRDDPQNRRIDALRALAGILQQRDKFENHELTLLTLRSAAVRIALDKSDDGLRTAMDLLWHAALLFEENPVHVAITG